MRKKQTSDDSVADALEARDRSADVSKSAEPVQRIARASQACEEAAEELFETVRDARALGYSWAAIGHGLGVSRQVAHEKYGPLTEQRRPVRNRDSSGTPRGTRR